MLKDTETGASFVHPDYGESRCGRRRYGDTTQKRVTATRPEFYQLEVLRKT